MSTVFKNVSFSWEWTGDERLLRGFNLALCKVGDTPATAIIAYTFVAMTGTSETPVTLTPSYTFRNVLLENGIYCIPYVQAVYPGDDSNWIASTGAEVSDDGKATLSIGLEIGGRNLVRNSNFVLGTTIADHFSIYNTDPTNEPTTALIVNTGGVDNGRFQRVSWLNSHLTSKGIIFQNLIGWLPYTSYTISAYVKTTSLSSGPTCELYWNTNPISTVVKNNPPVSINWQRYEWEITWGASVEAAGNTYLSVGYGSDSGNIEFSNVQIESGTSATAWKPAFEDTYWDTLADPNATKPEDNATVGAPAGTNVAGVPAEDIVGKTSGLDVDGNIIKIISGINLPTTGMSDGLNITKDYLGYYDATPITGGWKSYLGSDGRFALGGKVGDDGNIGVYWNGVDTLAIKGDIYASNITGGAITGATFLTASSTFARISISTITENSYAKSIISFQNSSGSYIGDISISDSASCVEVGDTGLSSKAGRVQTGGSVTSWRLRANCGAGDYALDIAAGFRLGVFNANGIKTASGVAPLTITANDGISTFPTWSALAGTFVVDANGSTYTNMDGSTGWSRLLSDTPGIQTGWTDLYPCAIDYANTNAPAFTAYGGSGNLLGREFVGTGVLARSLFAEFQFPHNYMEGSTIDLHLHIYIPASVAGGTIKFFCVYSWNNIGSTGGLTETTISNTYTRAANSGIENNYLFEVGDIVGTSKEISSCLSVKVYRDPGDAEDTFAHSVWMRSIDCHYQIDSASGSREEYTK